MPTRPSNQSDYRTLATQHLQILYPDHNTDVLVSRISSLFAGFVHSRNGPDGELWSENDSLLITYGDSLKSNQHKPLQTLDRFLDEFAGDVFSSVHVLPFTPYSSDDGFAVTDYCEVRSDLGDWSDLNQISQRYRMMADLVINHASSQSEWFQNFCRDQEPGINYFVEADKSDDVSQVVRPRTSPLLRPTETTSGPKLVWCTFSHDQVDLNFQNPAVLFEFLKIIRHYLEQGISIFRLDAVGFLWKQPGTPCIHLPETHEVVRLLRTVIDHFAPGTVLITETNVPNHENLSYFGNRNEAHVVYNFSLAPLVVHSLLTGETRYLKRWMMSMPPAPLGCTYLNFTASHDGIGMRPAEGLLSDEEQTQMVDTIVGFGGKVSTRRTSDGGERVYELNISLFDAMQGTIDGPDQYQIERFLCSQTVMMSVEGIPAFYIHSLLATGNDLEGLEATGHNRSINRRKLDYAILTQQLQKSGTDQHVVFNELRRRLDIRRRQPAFHPNATQFTLQLAEPFFAFWRQSMDRSQSIFAIHNMTAQEQVLQLADLNLIALDKWYDLLSNAQYADLASTITIAPYQCLWVTNLKAARQV